jgi:hypothetical protein
MSYPRFVFLSPKGVLIMKSIRLFSSVALLLLLAASVAGARSLDALNVVPADAVSVGMVRMSELRSSPLANRILSHCDRMTVEGEAERFLRESGFHPMEDVDTIVFALAPGQADREADVLIALEGRFDVDRLSKAIGARGATRVEASPAWYYRLPGHERDHDGGGAVALVHSGLALLGKESAVRKALVATARGGTDFARAGGLAHLLGKVDPNASAWMLVDVPRSTRLKGETRLPGKAGGDEALRAALRNVSVVAVWADDRGDQLELGGTAVSNDTETLGLLEDLLRGMMASWRLAAQDKAPDLVQAIRKFRVERSGDSVTLSGSIADEILEKFAKKSQRGYGK